MTNENNAVWEIYTVNSKYALPGKEVLAYRPNGWLAPFSSHIMKFVGVVEAPTEKMAIKKWGKLK